MNNKWRTEWSRHYDQVQWTATTIFTGVVGALLAYSYQQTGSAFEPIVAFLGLWITWLTIYYVASCREFRGALHAGLPEDEERKFLENRNEQKDQQRVLWQWPAFLLTFVLLICGWLYLFWRNGYRGWAIAFAVASVFGIPIIWKRAKTNGLSEQIPAGDSVTRAGGSASRTPDE